MRKTILKIAISLSLIFSMNLLSAQDIKFSGQVFSKNNSLDDVKIEVFDNNEKVKEGFEFDIEMEKERDFRYVSKFNVDDPVAHVFYNHSKQEFDWDKELTQEKHDEIAALKELNKDKRNDKYSKF